MNIITDYLNGVCYLLLVFGWFLYFKELFKRNKNMCYGNHTFSKYGNIENLIASKQENYSKNVQYRTCKKCNYLEKRYV
jgi:hypothetical protein